MTKHIAERLGLTTSASKISLTFSDQSTKTLEGFVRYLGVKVGNCIVLEDSQVLDLVNGSDMPLILGRGLMATEGEIVDMVENNISFSYIDKNVYYKAIPPGKGVHIVPYVKVSYKHAATTPKSASHKRERAEKGKRRRAKQTSQFD